ncbi:MAG: thiamine phosphate synthase [Pyrinomonadaceae bacterium]|nr:thiamine phosphate synthase [Pyrinomonadaceae bacterium]
MSPRTTKPLSYLITDGATTLTTTPSSEEFTRLLALVHAAVCARVSLIQLREKLLRPRVLYELTARAAELTGGTQTRLLVNDRADIARAAGADGVHLTAQSLSAAVVRRALGETILVGVSTHSLAEATAARADGANFVVFGPIFNTPSKSAYGPPLGLAGLRATAHALAPFPLLALGGVTPENIPAILGAGASGVAAIRLFGEAEDLKEVVSLIESAGGIQAAQRDL